MILPFFRPSTRRTASTTCMLALALAACLEAQPEDRKKAYDRLETEALDVSQVTRSGTAASQADEATKALSGIMANADPRVRMHVVTMLADAPNARFMPLILEALKLNAQESDHHAHAKLSAILAHAQITGKSPDEKELRDLAFHHKGQVRLHAADVISRTAGSAMKATLLERLPVEGDAATRVILLTTLAKTDAENRTKWIGELQKIANTPASDFGDASWRSKDALNELGLGASVATKAVNPSDKDAAASSELTKLGGVSDEEPLFRALEGDNHDLRMYAIRRIAAGGTPAAREKLLKMGQSEDWRSRLYSAYALLLQKSPAEASARLGSETHPMVQIALLLTIANAA